MSLSGKRGLPPGKFDIRFQGVACMQHIARYSKLQNECLLPCRRNTLDHDHLRNIGFIVYALGKPLDPFIVKAYS